MLDVLQRTALENLIRASISIANEAQVCADLHSLKLESAGEFRNALRAANAALAAREPPPREPDMTEALLLTERANELRDLLIAADSVCSLIAHRYMNGGVPADLREELLSVSGRARKLYRGTVRYAQDDEIFAALIRALSAAPTDTRPDTDALRERAERLHAWISKHSGIGGCRVLSEGDACKCVLCDRDAVIDAALASTPPQLPTCPGCGVTPRRGILAEHKTSCPLRVRPSAPQQVEKRVTWVTQAAIRYALGHSNLGEFINEVVEMAGLRSAPPSAAPPLDSRGAYEGNPAPVPDGLADEMRAWLELGHRTLARLDEFIDAIPDDDASAAPPVQRESRDAGLLADLACVLVPLADGSDLDDTASSAIGRMPKYWQILVRRVLQRLTHLYADAQSPSAHPEPQDPQ